MIIRNLFISKKIPVKPVEYVAATNAEKIRFNLCDYAAPAGAEARVYVERYDGTVAYVAAELKKVTVGGINEKQREIDAVELTPTTGVFSVPGPAVIQVQVVKGDTVYVSFPVSCRIFANRTDGSEAGNLINIFDEYLDELREAIDKAQPLEMRNHDGDIQWRHEGEDEWKTIITYTDLKGETGPAGPAGPAGADGKSAYEIALEQGWTGNATMEYIESITVSSKQDIEDAIANGTPMEISASAEPADGLIIAFTDVGSFALICTGTAEFSDGGVGVPYLTVDAGEKYALIDYDPSSDNALAEVLSTLMDYDYDLYLAVGLSEQNWVASLKGPAGPAGPAPVKGTDYWTAADKADIVDDVLASLNNADTTSF